MVYLWIFLLILCSILLLIIKSWYFDFKPINQWKNFHSKDKKSWFIYNIYSKIKTAQLRLIVVDNILITLILIQFTLIWQTLLILFAINLIIYLLLKISLFREKIDQIIIKNSKYFVYFIKIVGFKPLKIYQMPKIASPKLESVENFEYLIKNTEIIDEKTKKIILASRKYYDYIIENVYQPTKNFGKVEIVQELTPKIVDDLYKINEKYAFIKEKTKIVNLVALKEVGAIRNSSFGRISDMVDVDLPKFDIKSDISEVISELLDQDYVVGLVTKNGRIVGLVELKDLLKIIKII